MIRKCGVCHFDFEDNERVIYSSRETFVWKPANVPEAPGVRAASASPEELRESRKDHMKTAIVNTFVDWGRAEVPESAFNFRHQFCEPQRTGSGGPLHPANKHAIRFSRGMARRGHGQPS